MKCPTCQEAKLVSDTRDLIHTYKGETTRISNVTGDHCPACAEAILDLNQSTRVGAAMMAFNRQVNASIVDPDFIVNVRKKL